MPASSAYYLGRSIEHFFVLIEKILKYIKLILLTKIMIELHKIFFPLLILFLITFFGCYTTLEKSDKKDRIEIKDNIIIKDSLELRGDCIITGKISNAYTNKPIRGANVVVVSNPQGTVTDLYGQFDMINLPAGTYTLQIFCVGYYEKIIPDIEIKSNRLIKLNIKLVPKK